METKLKSWGTSLAVRLPKKHLDALNMVEGDAFQLILKGDGFELIKTEGSDIPASIKELLAGYAMEANRSKSKLSIIEIYHRMQEDGSKAVNEWLASSENQLKLAKAWDAIRDE